MYDGAFFISSLKPHHYAIISTAPLAFREELYKTAEEDGSAMFRTQAHKRISELGREPTQFIAYVFGIAELELQDSKKSKLVYALQGIPKEKETKFDEICLTELEDILDYQWMNQVFR